MKILQDNFDTKLKFSTYAALGSFDGLHIGHMNLMQKVIEKANANKAKSLVFTFDNHPLTVINKEAVVRYLIDKKMKNDILQLAGIDVINYAHFNEKFMKIQPETFIKNMIECYDVKGIVVGFNYKFGYKNKGDINLLKKLSKVYKFELYIVEPIKYNGEIVSSSKIRNLILEGNIKKANKMLNRPYMIRGTVVEGRKLGRTWGFPTANLEFKHNYVLPSKGVYYTNVEYNGQKFKGITNIGTNPTVNGKKLTVETNILEFDKEIYNEKIKLYFIEKMRDQKKFESVKELSNQLKLDKKFAQNEKLKV